MSRRNPRKAKGRSARAASNKVPLTHAAQRTCRGWSSKRIKSIIAILKKFDKTRKGCAHGDFFQKVNHKLGGLSYVSLHELHSAWRRLRDRKRTGSRWFKAALKKMGQKRTAALARLPESERWKAWKEGIQVGSATELQKLWEVDRVEIDRYVREHRVAAKLWTNSELYPGRSYQWPADVLTQVKNLTMWLERAMPRLELVATKPVEAEETAGLEKTANQTIEALNELKGRLHELQKDMSAWKKSLRDSQGRRPRLRTRSP